MPYDHDRSPDRIGDVRRYFNQWFRVISFRCYISKESARRSFCVCTWLSCVCFVEWILTCAQCNLNVDKRLVFKCIACSEGLYSFRIFDAELQVIARRSRSGVRLRGKLWAILLVHRSGLRFRMIRRLIFNTFCQLTNATRWLYVFLWRSRVEQVTLSPTKRLNRRKTLAWKKKPPSSSILPFNCCRESPSPVNTRRIRG